MESIAVTLIVLSSLAFFAALGGCISYIKRRPPLEGCLLGGALGPIGLVILWKMSFAHRPMVDRGAWNSFHSLVNYQDEVKLLRLTHATPQRALPRPR